MSPSAVVSSAFRSRSGLIAIAVCWTITALDGFDLQAVGATAPSFAAELGFNAGELGWLFGLGNVGLIIGSFVGGRVSDLIDRRLALALMVATFGCGTLALAFQSSLIGFIAFRAIAGIGLGAAIPIVLAIIADASPNKERFLTTAITTTGFSFGGLAASGLLSISPPIPWRHEFLVGGGLSLAALGLLLLLPTKQESRTTISDAPPPPILNALFGEGRALATLLLWATFFLALITLYMLYYWLPLLMEAKGVDRAATPRALLAFNIAAVPGAFVFGALCDRFGVRVPATMAYALAAAAFLGLAVADEFWILLAMSACLGFLIAGGNTVIAAFISMVYPRNLRGVGGGATYTVARMGSIVGPLAAGLLLSANVTASAVLQLTAVVAVGAAVGMNLLARKVVVQTDAD